MRAFAPPSDGRLANRRVWADLTAAPGSHPDGICLDTDGAVWYADVPARCCVRVREGGEVLDAISLDRGCFACALGGADRRTLFMVAAAFPTPFGPGAAPTGQVLTAEAPALAAGWP